MIHTNLLDKVLIKPFEQNNADKLCIVSGYATSAMASNHFEILEKVRKQKGLKTNVSIELIIGMCLQDGIEIANHRGFQKLADEDFVGRFGCSYIDRLPAVHSKVYIWLTNNIPIKSFIGSANYTQNAFFREQREVLIEADPQESYKYYQSLINETVYCTHLDAENFVKTSADKSTFTVANSVINITGLPKICVSFLDKNGNLPAKSGLNWGLDGNGNKRQPSRTGNEAYIRITAKVYNTDFFPPIAEQFTIITDDNKSLLCTREQSSGKSITTPNSNSQMGEYFRRRLGLPSGAWVLKSHLETYGRTDVCFYKLDEESYFMDFSV